MYIYKYTYFYFYFIFQADYCAMNKAVVGIEPLCPTNSSYLGHNLWTRTSQRVEEEEEKKNKNHRRETREKRISYYFQIGPQGPLT